MKQHSFSYKPLSMQINKMKFLLSVSIFCVSITLIGTSCQKQVIDQVPANPRKIQFVLYSDKDFSNDNGNISFTLSIQKLPNQVLWDSALSQMRIKDIPDLAHKLVIEKLVPNNDKSLLKVGFHYSIENVGSSSHWNSSNAGETFTIVDFNFQ